MQNLTSGMRVKPFILLIYVLTNLECLSRDEFTYILPLCLRNSEANKYIEIIKEYRESKITIEQIIENKMYSMKNYKEALEFMNNNEIDTLEKFAKVDMNRKSKDNSKHLFEFYLKLKEIVKTELNEDKMNVITDFIKVQSNKNPKVAKYWKDYFEVNSRIVLTEKWKEHLKATKIFNTKDFEDFNNEFFRIMQTAKWKATLEDYADLNRRYFSLTDILIFKDDKVKLDILPKYYFLNIAEKLLNTEFLDTKEYKKYIENDLEFEKIYDCLNVDINSIITQIKIDYPNSNIMKNNVKEFIKDERIKRFKELIDNKFKRNDIIMLFKNIETDNRKEIEEYLDCDATIPTILEYILGIAWYQISNKQGNILDFMKLSLDANLLPKNHAGGGTADIIYCYNETKKHPKHDVLLEATLTDSTAQRKSEMEPVSRHLIRNLQEYDNIKTYAIFVANILNQEVLSDFRSRRNYWYEGKNGEKKRGLKIIPLSIEDIINILEKNIEYNDLYKLFEQAYIDKEINDLDWYKLLIQNQIKTYKNI